MASDPRSLQELASDIETDMHLLATGLAHAGVPPKITQEIEENAQLFAGIQKSLASGPVGAQPVSPGGQPGESPGGAPTPPGPEASAPPPGPPSPQNQINGSSPTGAAHGDLHNSIVEMHKASVNAAARA